MSSLSFLYQNSFSFLLSAGLRLHAPVTRSYQHLIVCNLWLLHFFTPFPDLFFLAPLDCNDFPGKVCLSDPCGQWGASSYSLGLLHTGVQIVVRQGCLGKGRGWKLKFRVHPTPFTFLYNGRTFLSLLSLFHPLLTDSYFIKWIIIHLFRCSNCLRFGQWEHFQGGSCVLLTELYHFGESFPPFCTIKYSRLIFTFLAPVPESVISPEILGSF